MQAVPRELAPAWVLELVERRYTWESDTWQREIILEYTDGLPRFTWNIMSAPVSLLPAGP